MNTQTQTATAGIIVSPEEWLQSRQRLLEKEKEFTRLRVMDRFAGTVDESPYFGNYSR